MTIGDVLAVIAGVLTIYLTWVAAIVATALIARMRVDAAREHIEVKLNQSAWTGFGVVLVMAFICVRLNHMPHAKYLELVIVALTCAVGLIGSAAVAKLVAGRFGPGEDTQNFPAVFKAAALLVGAALSPVVGWLFILPALIFVSVGAGIVTLGSRKRTDHILDMAPSKPLL